MIAHRAIAEAIETVSVPYVGGPLDGTFLVIEAGGSAPQRDGAYRLVSVSTKTFRRPIITRNIYLHDSASHDDAIAFVRSKGATGG